MYGAGIQVFNARLFLNLQYYKIYYYKNAMVNIKGHLFLCDSLIIS